MEHNYWLDNEESGENEVLQENTNKLLAILEEKEEEILDATLQAIFLEEFTRLRIAKCVKQS